MLNLRHHQIAQAQQTRLNVVNPFFDTCFLNDNFNANPAEVDVLQADVYERFTLILL